jgi:hypothetical protein
MFVRLDAVAEGSGTAFACRLAGGSVAARILGWRPRNAMPGRIVIDSVIAGSRGFDGVADCMAEA